MGVGEVFFLCFVDFGLALAVGSGDGVCDGLGEDSCFGVADGLGVGVAFFSFDDEDVLRFFRAGVGVGVAKTFLIFSPMDCSACAGSATPNISSAQVASVLTLRAL